MTRHVVLSLSIYIERIPALPVISWSSQRLGEIDKSISIYPRAFRNINDELARTTPSVTNQSVHVKQHVQIIAPGDRLDARRATEQVFRTLTLFEMICVYSSHFSSGRNL